MQSLLNEPDSTAWQHIAPLLDEALNCLGTKEHDAVVLRFFDGKELKQVGAAMGTTEDGARMRVNRGLEKLREFFTKRGVTVSAAAFAGVVSTYSVQAAPVGLAKSVTAVAVTKGAAVSGSTLTLIKGALKLMAWTKARTAIVIGAVAIAVGTSTVGGFRMVRPPQQRISFLLRYDATNVQSATNALETLEAALMKRFAGTGTRISMAQVSTNIIQVTAWIKRAGDIEFTRTLIGSVDFLEFRLVHEDSADLIKKGVSKPGYKLLGGTARLAQLLVKIEPELTGHVQSAVLARGRDGKPQIGPHSQPGRSEDVCPNQQQQHWKTIGDCA